MKSLKGKNVAVYARLKSGQLGDVSEQLRRCVKHLRKLKSNVDTRLVFIDVSREEEAHQ